MATAFTTNRPYAIDEEAYPALVVHGPLQATLLIDIAVRHLNDPVASFSFRGQQPAFDGMPVYVCGTPTENGAELWTQQGEAKNIDRDGLDRGPIVSIALTLGSRPDPLHEKRAMSAADAQNSHLALWQS